MSLDVATASGTRKAAILLVSVGQERAAQVLRTMREAEVTEIMAEIARLTDIEAEDIEAVQEDFTLGAQARKYISQGGVEFARAVLEASVGEEKANEIFDRLSYAFTSAPFEFLRNADPRQILSFIQDEHPQTIALILCHLSHHKASEILVGLAMEKQLEVIKRIANMEQTNPEVIREVERGLESRLSNMLMQSMEKAGGVPTVSEILNLTDRATEKTIMEGLESDDPDLVEEIRRLMFVFEDIKLVNDKGIQAVLKEIENDELSLSLKTASEQLKQKIFSNMSERAASMVKEDMEFMGPVRVSDVENAQQRIVDIVRRLEESGDVMIEGRGGDSEMIV